MKICILFLALLLLPCTAWADEHELTGDTRLACEAILCLSSGIRPGECGPSLSRYFGISHKKWKDTVKARRSFLNQCPTVGEDANMPSLVEAILQGAGRCNAQLLNRELRKRIVIEECIPYEKWIRFDRDARPPRCRDKYVWIIDDTLPSYCRTYSGHEYTWKVGVNYVGEPLNGGHWIDE